MAIDALRAPLLVQELGKLELLVGVVLAMAGVEVLANDTVGLAGWARPLLLTGATEGNAALLLGWERRSLQTRYRSDRQINTTACKQQLLPLLYTNTQTVRTDID